ncbi:Early light-induced protein 1, chloroplastic, partial [Cucurbita argyrosperma subsp. argyrosperma]
HHYQFTDRQTTTLHSQFHHTLLSFYTSGHSLMAASAVMQSILASSASRNACRTPANRLLPAAVRPFSRRAANFRVRCTAEEDQREPATPPSVSLPSPQPGPSPTPSPKMSTKLTDILAFSGPAPERINGRLAMVGFVAALAVEAAKGQDVLEQIGNGGIPWFVGTSAILTLASLIPFIRGVSVESNSKGFMTSKAELWNGRFAMLGLLALAFTEYVTGGSLV